MNTTQTEPTVGGLYTWTNHNFVNYQGSGLPDGPLTFVVKVTSVVGGTVRYVNTQNGMAGVTSVKDFARYAPL